MTDFLFSAITFFYSFFISGRFNGATRQHDY
jgi:hypothetical protein